MAEERVRISKEDLFTPQVEDYLEAQSYLLCEIGPVDDQPWIVRLIFSNWLYLSFWGMTGGLTGWILLEPFFSDFADEERDPAQLAVALLLFPTVAAFVGMFLGAAEGVMCRNPLRAFISGLVGLGVGFVGGLIALIPTGILFGIIQGISRSFNKNPEGGMPTGLALLIYMMGRAMAWALISIPSGIGQGIAIRERKVILNGLLGAVMGGFIGGLAFDPISIALTPEGQEAWLSRAVGFGVIGSVVGLMIGLVEGWTKTAWLLMKKGPLAGKQFILYKDTTVVGSSPKAEIYLFKDEAIEPKHVLIHNRGGRFEIEDCGTPDGTYVNGNPIKRAYLQSGDQIVLGKTVLEFMLREAK